MTKGIYKRTEYHNNISKKNGFKKGNIPWNKGKTGFKVSEETKNKIRKSLLGRPCPTKGKKISKEHIAALVNSRKGKPNLWKNGKSFTKKRYILIFQPEHPFRNVSKYVMEHRLVMEKHIGRYLSKIEVVHHKGIKYPINSDENRSDNRIENLHLCANEAEHRKFHKKLIPFNIS